MTSRATLKHRITQGPIVFDGAMGTELYRRGLFVNKPFETANLSHPALVSAVHDDYLAAGAEVLTTNTFSANAIKLRRVGLEEQHLVINQRAVELAREAAGDRAYVVGAIGPSGIAQGWADRQARAELPDVFKRQAEALLDAGVDGIALETFSSFEELLIALTAVREMTDKAVVALASFTRDGATADGATPEDIITPLRDAGADLLGANCADGPHALFEIAERLVPSGAPIAILPNAGYPRQVDGRLIYMATDEYFGVYARRLLKLGVRAVGGCCGTGPEHIKSMSAAARMVSGGRVEMGGGAVRASEEAEALTPVPFRERTKLSAKIAGDEGFVVSVEVNPPMGLDFTKTLRSAAMLEAAGVDVINIADGPRASVRTSNWSLGLQVQRELGLECILHVCARDRNLLGLQADILAYQSLDLRNLVIITGDPPKMGAYPDATAVFDLDSIGMLRLVRDFNRGLDPAGRQLKEQTSFAMACGAEPAALDYDRELRRLEQKVESGAEWIMTQPVYEPRVLERFLDDIAGFDVPVLVGLMPLASYRNAEFLHNEIPGMQVPEDVRERMKRYDRGPRARAEGVAIAQEMLLAVKDRVRGAYIMPPFGRYEAAVEILECIGYERPEAFVDTWRG